MSTSGIREVVFVEVTRSPSGNSAQPEVARNHVSRLRKEQEATGDKGQPRDPNPLAWCSQRKCVAETPGQEFRQRRWSTDLGRNRLR